MNQVKRQLKEVKKINGLVNPDRSWIVSNRARLIQQISNTVIPVEKPVIVDRVHAFWFQVKSSATFKVMRPVLTALSVAALATGGWIASVSASFNSLPGDRLWAVKRVAQNTEIAVKSLGASNDRKVQLQLNLAKSRVDDIKKAVAQKLSDTSRDVREKTAKDLNVATQDVQAAVKEVSANVVDQAKVATTKDNQMQVVETVKDVTKDTNALAKELTSTIASSTAGGVEVTKQVLETVRVVNQTGINAVEVVVRNQAELTKSGGETGAAKNIVSEKVVDLVQSTEALKAVVVLPVSSKPIENLEKVLPNASSSVPINLIKEVEQKIITTTSTRESEIEIKKNIDSGNLQEAVNGLRELNETTVTAQQLLVETKTKVEIEKR